MIAGFEYHVPAMCRHGGHGGCLNIKRDDHVFYVVKVDKVF